MYHLKTAFLNEAEAESYAAASESGYEVQLAAAGDYLLSRPQIQFMTITGPTCSGKTTTCAKLCRTLEEAGHDLYMVSFDDFYKNRADLPLLPDGNVDYETAATIDLDCLASCIGSLLREEPAQFPVFNFETGCRDGYREYVPRKNDIVILEGIQAIYPEVQALLPAEITVNVGIMPENDVMSGEAVFSRREIRLLRRLVRDAKFRAASAERTLAMWADVCANEDRNILPYLDNLDIFINSFLPYELCVIRPFAEKVLRELPDDSAYVSVRDSLLSRLRSVAVISPELVPDDSVFREFIGKRETV